MEQLDTDRMTFTQVSHLPIGKQSTKHLTVVETIYRVVDSPYEITYGHSKYNRPDLNQLI